MRPVGFMEVIPPPGIGRSFFLGAMAALLGNTKQKYVACDDIGKTVAMALLNPARLRERILTITGQVATVTELQAALENGEGQRGWPRVWLPRWLAIRLTPHHYKQMFDVSVSISVSRVLLTSAIVAVLQQLPTGRSRRDEDTYPRCYGLPIVGSETESGARPTMNTPRSIAYYTKLVKV